MASTDGTNMSQDGLLDQCLAEFHSRLEIDNLSEDERRETLRAMAVLRPAEAARWASLAASTPDKNLQFLGRALVAAPGDFRVHVNLSNQLLRSGEARGAKLLLRRAGILEPQLGRVYGTLAALSIGNARKWEMQARHWLADGTAAAAIGFIERQTSRGFVAEPLRVIIDLLAVLPLDAEAWRLHGVLLHKSVRSDESIKSHMRSIVCNPSTDNAYLAASALLLDLRKFGSANRMLDYAELISPHSHAAMMNRGAIFERQGRIKESLTIARKLLLLNPERGDRYFGCGSMYHEIGHFDAALKVQSRARIAAPDDLRFRNNLAVLLLKLGRYQEGFEAYEERWHAPMEFFPWVRSLGPEASFDLPIWRPERESNGRVLIWGEQGIGDEIWGLSYLTALAGRSEKFTVEVDERLVPLVRRSFPAIDAIARSTDSPFNCREFDAQMPILSLPYRLGLADAPTPGDWMRVAHDRVHPVSGRALNGSEGPVIGLAWRSTKPNKHRSFGMSIERFSALRSLQSCRFLPLQYGMDEADWARLSTLFGEDRLIRPDFDVRDDLDSLANALASVDLLVTVATALVPMAGAVGTHSIVLLRDVQRDWRYRLGRKQSPLLPHTTMLWPADNTKPDALMRAVSDSLDFNTDNGCGP